MIRYHNAYPLGKLIYLNLDGRKATEASARNLVAGADYYCISYKEHILKWMETCLEKSASKPLLREGIAHYIELIKYLTNQTSSKKMSKDIINIIIKSPENIAAVLKLKENFNGAKAKIQKKFWAKLIETLEDNHLEVLNKMEFLDKMGGCVWAYYNKTTNNKYYYIRILVAKIDDKEIFWQCSIDHNVYVGFTVRKGELPREEGEKICTSDECQAIRAKVHSLNNNYALTDWWLGWKYTTPQLDFKAFNSPEVLSMADDMKLKEITDAIVYDAVSEINQLKELLKQ